MRVDNFNNNDKETEKSDIKATSYSGKECWQVRQGTRGTFTRKYVSTLVFEHLSTQGTLAHKRVNTQGTLACKHVRHAT